ncbi:MAG: NF038122 family metalloprotease [Planctomycetota bacterium]
MIRCSALGLALCLTIISQTQAALTFNITSTGNPQADAGFAAAADFWSNIYNDDITVNVNAGFSSLGGSILGQASSPRVQVSYANFRNAIVADASSADDTTFSSNLPAGNALSVFINETNEATGASNENPYLDNDNGANNTTMQIPRANAKALGLVNGNSGVNDTTITFNSDFAFDFDQSDGIEVGQIDFVGVAIHELGHAMGFVSGVDVLDANDDGNFNDDAFIFITAMDLTRHSVESVAAGADLDFTADNRAKFYSLDGGTTIGGGVLAGQDHFSRGFANGDLRQASHWRDGLGIGIMDPTAAPAGSLNVVTAADIQAFDVIGWTLTPPVPEPTSAGLLGLFALAMVSRRRRYC